MITLSVINNLLTQIIDLSKILKIKIKKNFVKSSQERLVYFFDFIPLCPTKIKLILIYSNLIY